MQNITNNQSNCENITSATVHYKKKGATDFHIVNIELGNNTITIAPGVTGQYEIMIVIENNEGYSSSSDIRTIVLRGKSLSRQM